MALLAVEAMREVGVDPVIAVASDELQAGRLSEALSVPSVVDRWPGEGPLGGLLTALLWYRTGSLLSLPCDLPLVTGRQLEPLARHFQTGDTEAVVVRDEHGPNCTIGIWPASLATPLKAKFDAGARRLDTVLQLANTTQLFLDDRAVLDADTEEQLHTLLGRRTSDESPGPPPR